MANLKITLSDDDKEELARGFEAAIDYEVYVSSWGGCGCAEYTIEDKDLAARECVRFLVEFLEKDDE